MSIRTGLLVICAAVLMLIGGSLYVASRALGTQADIALAEGRRHHSSRLADELRQSSDDLTRMARLHVVTGEARYKAYFERILAIRDGKAPRPIDYGNVYWDFVVAWGKAPRRDGQVVALERLMREAQFTDDEMALLQQAKHRSDALVALESRAMHAVQGRFQDARGEFTIAGAPDLDLARRLMHGPEYHLAKAEIMSPIHDFLDRVDARTAAEVAQLRRHGHRLNSVVIFGLGTAVALVLVSFALVARYPLAPLGPRHGPASLAATPLLPRGAAVWTAWPLFAAALAASGAVLALSWWLSATIADRVRGDVRNGLEAVHQATARAVDDWLAGIDRDARAWARSSWVRTPPAAESPGAARPAGPGALPIEKTPSLVGYAILDREGRVVAGDDGDARGRRVELLSALRASPQHSLVVFRGASGAEPPGQEVIAAAGMPGARGDIDGALVLRFDPRVELTRLLRRGHLGESGETYAFTRAGGRVTERRSGEGESARPAPPAFTRMSRAALAGYSGMDVDGYRDERGVPVIGAWTWNERYGIGIATEVGTGEAYGALGEYLRQTRLGAGLSVALILGLGGVFAWNRMALAAAGAKLETAHEVIRGHRDRMEAELNVGRDLQLSMLPRAAPAFAGRDEVSIHATLRPAREVAGDFYDYYFVDPGHVFFCIGDVSDKGVAAALFMAVARTLIRTRTTDDASPASVVAYLNAELARDNDRCMFVTLFAGRLDVASGELVYTNAGHEPPYLRGADGSVARLDERHGPLVGVAPGAVYGESRRRLAPGDVLLAYTDGVTEAKAAQGEPFSEERVLALMRAGGPASAEGLVDRLLAEVTAFAQDAEPFDDIAVLALQLGPGATAELVETLVIRNQMTELDRVAEVLERFGDRSGLPASTMADLRVVCDEVLSNVIAYAFPGGGEHDIELRLAMGGGRLIARVSDAGMPFDPLSAAPPNLEAPLAERQIGGLGIHLMRTLFDEMAYERRDDRNVLTLTKDVAARA